MTRRGFLSLDCIGEGVAGPGLGLRAGGLEIRLGLDLGIFLLERGGDGDGDGDGELDLGLDLGVFLSGRDGAGDGEGEEEDAVDLPKKAVI